MELLEAIYHRRSIRSYTDQPVPAHMIMSLLDAAIQAPSSANQQAWAFAVIRGVEPLARYSDRAKLHLLARLPQTFALNQRSDALNDGHFNLFYGAGTLVVVCARPALYPAEDECCLAAQNFMLAAHAMGLGTCPVGFVRPWLNLTEIKSELGIPDSYMPVLPIVVGWPAGAVVSPPQRREAEVVAWTECTEHTRLASPLSGQEKHQNPVAP